MARFIGALALVVSFGFFADAQAAHYEYMAPVYIVHATRLLPPHAPSLAIVRGIDLPMCRLDVCESNVLCEATQCSDC